MSPSGSSKANMAASFLVENGIPQVVTSNAEHGEDRAFLSAMSLVWPLSLISPMD